MELIEGSTLELKRQVVEGISEKPLLLLLIAALFPKLCSKDSPTGGDS